MTVSYRNFDKNHILDNELQYFMVLESIINNIDNHCYFTITRAPNSYNFRISTSMRIVDPIIKEINSFNTNSGIKAEFSKSMKSGNIFWKIQLNA